MEELEKYLNKCYLENNIDFILVYKLIKRDNKIGLIIHEAGIKPTLVSVYEDFPEIKSFEDIKFLRSFVPELDEECRAKEISEKEYYDLTQQIDKLYSFQKQLKEQIKDFVYGLGEKV